ncbi:hypothetical protein [Escherichia coli]|uniref:hypothetical protein n=1 Tax=Escherichia coli TaxID=562 RepID=UPI001AAFB5D4|nr:hypothetical protein [Escherichia coli]QTF30096.1 hypothetical protein JSU13_16905 [Escherichia coli O89m:H9]
MTQVTPYPFALLNLPGCRSISDDDLCAWCSHLLYHPGELSLCRLSLADGHWPSHFDEDGYAQSCQSLHFNKPPEK